MKAGANAQEGQRPSIAGTWAYTANFSRQVENGPLEECTIQGVTLVLDPLDPTSQELPRPFTDSASGGEITCSLGADQHVQLLSTIQSRGETRASRHSASI